jgi:AraC-like DNA-binding protein
MHEFFAIGVIVDADLRSLFEAAYGSLIHSQCALTTEERVLSLLKSLALRCSSDSPRTGGRAGDAKLAATAREYIEAHFAEKVTLADLARVCGVSSFHLIRVFGRRCGLPPHAYLRQVRVGRALRMLRQGGVISDVAYSGGFSDQSHLTRSVKRNFGVSPGTYQRAVTVHGSLAPRVE